MTNRTDYTQPTLAEPETKASEVLYLASTLTMLNRPRTLDEATALLAFALENAPNSWQVTVEELPALWAELGVEL